MPRSSNGLHRYTTAELERDPGLVAEIRSLIAAAFGAGEDDEDDGGFTDEDWAHALGGIHLVLDEAGVVIAHASVVERELRVAGRALRTGYVEAVAVVPDRQGEGLGSRIMEAVDADIRQRFDLGGLSTGRASFYERLGWRAWIGPTAVRTGARMEPTPDDDGSILVLLTPSTPPLDLTATISCEWRAGDVW